MKGRKGKAYGTLILAAIVIFGIAAVLAWRFREKVTVNLFGPPQVTLTESYEETPDGPSFDHSALDSLLARHVAAGGWVDYDGLQSDREELDRYIESVAAAPFDNLGRNEKLALLINSYNAFTLRLILDHYPLASIQDIPSSQRWDDVRWNLGGNTWSLNQIEHEQIRPKFREPRIHFALVCAAVGCPPLRAEAYRAEQIEAQLQDQAEFVHRHKTWFEFDTSHGDLHLTRLYQWYGGDFEQVIEGSVKQYAARYSPELRQALAEGQEPAIQWLEYDWRLNGKRNASAR